ncbi:unnamed protein product [Vitrella brassicaformis CCMP3155]|uniref:Uncharacterized protein n=1 Tax=Vitrella brassicaformis (strain CCMP3155) TaxID=1169540 RepID=A0A0G4EWP1_VITBC|nr:unnamed protein product [Vitrella brassicaformis CCMP3155]|eukprot:CEM02484.1 unnamed protein product [Vitrella brassicaformis CCMP3155]
MRCWRLSLRALKARAGQKDWRKQLKQIKTSLNNNVEASVRGSINLDKKDTKTADVAYVRQYTCRDNHGEPSLLACAGTTHDIYGRCQEYDSDEIRAAKHAVDGEGEGPRPDPATAVRAMARAQIDHEDHMQMGIVHAVTIPPHDRPSQTMGCLMMAELNGSLKKRDENAMRMVYNLGAVLDRARACIHPVTGVLPPQIAELTIAQFMGEADKVRSRVLTIMRKVAARMRTDRIISLTDVDPVKGTDKGGGVSSLTHGYEGHDAFPGDVKALYRRAKAHMFESDLKAAAADIQAALAIEPANTDIRGLYNKIRDKIQGSRSLPDKAGELAQQTAAATTTKKKLMKDLYQCQQDFLAVIRREEDRWTKEVQKACLNQLGKASLDRTPHPPLTALAECIQEQKKVLEEVNEICRRSSSSDLTSAAATRESGHFRFWLEGYFLEERPMHRYVTKEVVALASPIGRMLAAGVLPGCDGLTNKAKEVLAVVEEEDELAEQKAKEDNVHRTVCSPIVGGKLYVAGYRVASSKADTKTEEISVFFYKTMEWIQNAIVHGGRVLVHCREDSGVQLIPMNAAGGARYCNISLAFYNPLVEELQV